MSLSQQLIWTAVPDGNERTGRTHHLHINIHVSFRLGNSGGVTSRLQDFPAIEKWADTVNAARFVLKINGRAVEAERAETFDGRKRAFQGYWSAILTPQTPVVPFQFEDLSKTRLLTYPLAHLAQSIETSYADLALAATDDELPKFHDLLKALDFGAENEIVGLDTLLKVLEARDDPLKPLPPKTMIALLEGYHRPLSQEKQIVTGKRLRPDGTPDPDDPHEGSVYRGHRLVDLPDKEDLHETFDFHRIVSALGQHPILMRAVGIVVPLRVEVRGTMAGSNVTVELAEVSWDHGHGVTTHPDILPITHAELTDADFRPCARRRPNPSSLGAVLQSGWLKVKDPRFKLLALDVDGAGLKLKNMAMSKLADVIDERQDDDAVDQGRRRERAGAPRLRTAGLQLAHVAQDKAVAQKFAESTQLNSDAATDPKPALFAEDVFRGWRVDVSADDGPWRSLMRCETRYTLVKTNEALPAAETAGIREEATIRLAPTEAADSDLPSGVAGVMKITEALFAWSGWSLGAPEEGPTILENDSTGEDGVGAAAPHLPLESRFTVEPGTLPTLRFGHSYRVRLRAVDLAGSGVPHSNDDTTVPGAQSDAVFFGRFEAVETPSVALVKGSSDPADGESLTRAAMRLMDPDQAEFASSTVSRLVAPPPVGARFAEMHGVLDRNGRPAPDLYQLLVSRDKSMDVRLLRSEIERNDGSGEVHIVETKYPEWPVRTTTPWLDDPLCAGLAIRIEGLEGIDPKHVYCLPFYGDAADFDPDAWPDWPNSLPIEIVALDGTDKPEYLPAKREFVVPLGPAELARLHISALIPTRGQKMLALLHRLGPAASKIEAALGKGRHWMFTPWRAVELVHATQRPLVVPDAMDGTASRSNDATSVHIGFSTPLHTKSTQRLDMHARWLDIDDTDPDFPPQVIKCEEPAFSIPFHRHDHNTAEPLRFYRDHRLRDTRARRVFYRPTVTTRFREFMPRDLRRDPESLTKTAPVARAIWVPASSPPPAPVIRYIIPTFGWRDAATPDGGKSVWRGGGGLRVYLERPWFASGPNEMLAVVLQAGSGDPETSERRSFVTQWGGDPLWPGGKVTTIAPKPTDFPLRIRETAPFQPLSFPEADDDDDIPPRMEGVGPLKLTGFHPAGAPSDLRVDLVPHRVGYDAARKLWYADIVIWPGQAYFPFVRLALARYQPQAIGTPGQNACHLSPVVTAAFQQLAPDRFASLSPLGRNRFRLQIHGVLPSLTGEPQEDSPPRPSAGLVQVELQKRPHGSASDLDWVTVPHRPSRPPRPSDIPVDPMPHTDADWLREAKDALRLGNLEPVLRHPGLIGRIKPPIVHDTILTLPARENFDWRLLITEAEDWPVGSDGRSDGLTRQRRIVYAATIEIDRR
jgi:hypothetical protein